MKQPLMGILSKLLQCAKRHPAVISLLIVIAAILLVNGVVHGQLSQTIAYLAGVVVSAVLIDTVLAFGKGAYKPLPVRRPGMELRVASILFLVAEGWLISHFASSYHPSRLLNLVGFLFGMQVVLAVFLLACRYSPANLGIRLRGFAPVPFVMVFFALLTALVSPLTLIWRESYGQLGSVWNLIEVGVFTAGLPEEFFRMVWQTRLGAWLNNGAVGWLGASLLWSLLHAPQYGQGQTLARTLYSLVYIVPYGLLLGYLTFRTQSIFPSVLLHSTKFLWSGYLG